MIHKTLDHFGDPIYEGTYDQDGMLISFSKSLSDTLFEEMVIALFDFGYLPIEGQAEAIASVGTRYTFELNKELEQHIYETGRLILDGDDWRELLERLNIRIPSLLERSAAKLDI